MWLVIQQNQKIAVTSVFGDGISCQALVIKTTRLGIWEMVEPDGLLYLFSFPFLPVSENKY